MAETLPPPFVGPPDPLADAWLLRAIRTFIASSNMPEIAAEMAWHSAEKDSVKLSAEMDSALKSWKDLSDSPQQLADLMTSGAYGLIAWVLSFVTGLTFDSRQMQAVVIGSTNETKREALGQILTDLYAETLKTEKAAEGWKNRSPGDAELHNFRQLSGAAMRLSISDILIKWAGKAIPLGLAEGLDRISEKINDAVALDDALEEVVQVPMQAVIQRGLEAYYNRALKPADLSATEAFKARIADKITESDLGKILDNAGYRDDIRQTLRDFAASNLTESDINDAYQWNLFTREQVKEQYRNKFFEEEDRELKTKLVEMTRRQKLREKIFELYGNLYRDGVASKDEVRPFLQNYGYDNDEMDMWFQVQELERRQRKWMTDLTLLNLIKAGTFTEAAALDYLVLQGMTNADATAYLTLAIKEDKKQEVKEIEREVKATIAKLPKAVKDKCDDLLKPEDLLAELLAQLTGLIPGDILALPGAAKLKNYIECAIKAILTP